MDELSLIANTGIQLFTFPIEIKLTEKFKLCFHEWYDKENGQWCLGPIQELCLQDQQYYFNKIELHKAGYLSGSLDDIELKDLLEDQIRPLMIDDELCSSSSGEIFNFSFDDKDCKLSCYENVWLPMPYFFKKTIKKLKFGPLNWARFKLVPIENTKDSKNYNVVLAFDTRAKYVEDEYNECPVFPDQYRTNMDFELCNNEFYLFDYCTSNENWSYIDQYLFSLVNPNIQRVSQIKGNKTRKMSYISTYILLIKYFASKNLFPLIKLYKDVDVEVQNVDLVIDIGNSKTTALLVENNSNFNQVKMLNLIDYTKLIDSDKGRLCVYNEPFDMRLAFRKVGFGDFGISGSRQFVYPSLVRLGNEANYLIHQATNNDDESELLTTYSSPKRYLWDNRPNKEEWEFLSLKGEADNHILNLPGITNQLNSDGTISKNGQGGQMYHYSRRSLMTFSFLEMLVQARTQINSSEYRSNKTGYGRASVPRKIKRIIVTCPTGMSKVERTALVQCAKDAVILLENVDTTDFDNKKLCNVEVIPTYKSLKDVEPLWYYDEATCSQLVYMYGEVGHKYRGCCSEFFDIYGKKLDGDNQPSLTIASLDIGAGTSDLMISKYTYQKGDITTITPDPQFYDSYYFAGDDMLKGLIKNIMLFNEDYSAFRLCLKDLSREQYRQQIKNFFGPDYSGQTIADRTLRKDFNIQYSIPLMHYFLDLLSKNSKDCVVRYNDVFGDIPSNDVVIDGFKQRMGIDVRKLEWQYKKDVVADIVKKEFEPLLKKIATIIYSQACDVVLLSGRPASLSPIRDIFLKYYSISPNRLIVLNNYYVGDWYPFSNNTGYISNPKTIVAMGGIIGYYATELSNLNKFVLNLDNLTNHLKSTVNYIECSREGQPIEYVITPEKNRGELQVSVLPDNLKVRQIGMDSYPCRTLYTIDFNRYKMVEKIKQKNLVEGGEVYNDIKINSMVDEKIESMKRRLPFKLEIERDVEDKENLSIVSILDKNDNEVAESCLEIHIQSLGVDEKYWLDSGIFDF